MQIQKQPEILIKLNIELAKYHPDLAHIVSPTKPIDDNIRDLCTHFNILLDGLYDINDMCKLAEVLLKKLIEKRTSIILIN